MLDGLRKASKSIVAKALLFALAAAFALWGVADVFRVGADTVVAQVGQEQVTDLQYDLQLKNQMRLLQSQTQADITMEQLKAMGMDKQVLDQIVMRAALDDTSRRLGLTASREAIVAQTRNTDAFKGADGAFDPNLYLRALYDSGLTEQAYISATGKDIARAQLVNAAVGGIVPPPGLSRLLYDYVTEKRTMEYIVVTPEEAGQVPAPKPEDLEAFHKDHPEQFSAPEYRAFEYAMIGPEQVAAEITITEAELKTQYDTRRADYERPEQRDIEQIVFPSKEEADKAAARIKTPADFQTIANERGLKDADLKLGTFAKTAMDARLADAAFALAKGTASAPVQGPFGWVILRAANIAPGENKSFDEVKEQIREDILKIRAADRIRDLGDKLEDERGSGTSLVEAATKLNIPIRRIAAADEQGVTPEGGRAEIPPAPGFMQQVFRTESGEESDLFTSETGETYAVHVSSIMPVSVKPLASVREDVRTAFIADARAKLLQAKIDTFMEQARKEGNLVGVGRALRHAPVTSQPIQRNQADDVFSAALLAQLFGSPQGTFITGPAGRGTGRVIARVTKVEHTEPDVSAAQFAEYRRTASQQLVDTAIDSFANAARAASGVTIHQPTVQRVLGDTPQ
jgi:peptidyl-prolyl cis-trans isomerase D